jgi:predicted adenine nucleotide alpha hydrolase (AANH) superfamily ATPase
MKIALHICCAVCASGAAEKLIQLGYQVRGFFYNPNIYPETEYYRRLDYARRVAGELGFTLDEGPYIPADWSRAVTGLENEPEGGKRCLICFKMRLEKTFEYMRNSGCDSFASTITMGSNKSAKVIAKIGREVAGDSFADMDFKKQDGIKKANELARKWDLYRQHYCGCIYSLRAEELRRAKQVPNTSSST